MHTHACAHSHTHVRTRTRVRAAWLRGHNILSGLFLRKQQLQSEYQTETSVTDDFASSSLDKVWMVHSGYHPLKHGPLRIVLGWGTKMVEEFPQELKLIT